MYSFVPEINVKSEPRPTSVCGALSTFQRFPGVGGGTYWNYQVLAPNQNVFMSRYMRTHETFRITLTRGVGTAPMLSGSPIYGLRTLPGMRSKSSATIMLNGTAFPITQMRDFYPDIVTHFNGCYREKTALSYPDMYQNTIDGMVEFNAALLDYGNMISGFGPKRGCIQPTVTFPGLIPAGQPNAGQADTTGIYTTVLDYSFDDAIYLPGLLGLDQEDEHGLIRIKNISIAMQYTGKAADVFTFTPKINTGDVPSASLSIVDQPHIQCQFITVPQDLLPSGPLLYPHYRFERFTQAVGTSTIQPNGVGHLTLNNIQLSVVPEYMFLFVKPVAGSSNTISNPDVYTGLAETNPLTIAFNNQMLLATAESYDIWRMSKECGLIDSWSEWSGLSTIQNDAIGTKVGTCGSIIALQFGRHISLQDGLTIGQPGMFNFQITNLNFVNVNQTNAITDWECNLIFAHPHELIIDEGGTCFFRNPPLLQGGGAEEAHEVPWMGHFAPGHGVYGGSIAGWRKFTGFFKGVWNWLKNNHVLSSVANAVGPALSAIPGPIGQVGGPIASTIGSVASKLGLGGSVYNRDAMRRAIQAL